MRESKKTKSSIFLLDKDCICTEDIEEIIELWEQYKQEKEKTK